MGFFHCFSEMELDLLGGVLAPRSLQTSRHLDLGTPRWSSSCCLCWEGMRRPHLDPGLFQELMAAREPSSSSLSRQRPGPFKCPLSAGCGARSLAAHPILLQGCGRGRRVSCCVFAPGCQGAVLECILHPDMGAVSLHSCIPPWKAEHRTVHQLPWALRSLPAGGLGLRSVPAASHTSCRRGGGAWHPPQHRAFKAFVAIMTMILASQWPSRMIIQEPALCRKYGMGALLGKGTLGPSPRALPLNQLLSLHHGDGEA